MCDKQAERAGGDLVGEAEVEAEEVEAVVGRTAGGLVPLTRPVTAARHDRDVRHAPHPRLTQLAEHRLHELTHLSTSRDTQAQMITSYRCCPWRVTSSTQTIRTDRQTDGETLDRCFTSHARFTQLAEH